MRLQQLAAGAPTAASRRAGRIVRSPAVSLAVQGNAFTWTLARPNLPQGELYNPTFEVSIGPDGSFNVQGGNGELTSLRGLITGAHMAGQIEGKYCSYVFSAERS